MAHPRDLHRHIRRQIELGLGARSWNWLAKASGVAQSTLATQAGKPKFSVDVLIRVAAALDREVDFFLPDSTATAASRSDPISPEEALARIAEIASQAREWAQP